MSTVTIVILIILLICSIPLLLFSSGASCTASAAAGLTSGVSEVFDSFTGCLENGWQGFSGIFESWS